MKLSHDYWLEVVVEAIFMPNLSKLGLWVTIPRKLPEVTQIPIDRLICSTNSEHSRPPRPFINMTEMFCLDCKDSLHYFNGL